MQRNWIGSKKERDEMKLKIMTAAVILVFSALTVPENVFAQWMGPESGESRPFMHNRDFDGGFRGFDRGPRDFDGRRNFEFRRDRFGSREFDMGRRHFDGGFGHRNFGGGFGHRGFHGRFR